MADINNTGVSRDLLAQFMQSRSDQLRREAGQGGRAVLGQQPVAVGRTGGADDVLAQYMMGAEKLAPSAKPTDEDMVISAIESGQLADLPDVTAQGTYIGGPPVTVTPQMAAAAVTSGSPYKTPEQMQQPIAFAQPAAATPAVTVTVGAQPQLGTAPVLSTGADGSAIPSPQYPEYIGAPVNVIETRRPNISPSGAQFMQDAAIAVADAQFEQAKLRAEVAKNAAAQLNAGSAQLRQEAQQYDMQTAALSAEIGRRHQQWQETVDRAASVEPMTVDEVWESRGSGMRILAAIAASLDAFSSAKLGRPATVAKMIREDIEAEIRSQHQKRQSILGLAEAQLTGMDRLTNQFGSPAERDAARREMLLRSVQIEAQAMAELKGTPIALANAQQLTEQLDAMRMDNVAKLQLELAGTVSQENRRFYAPAAGGGGLIQLPGVSSTRPQPVSTQWMTASGQPATQPQMTAQSAQTTAAQGTQVAPVAATTAPVTKQTATARAIPTRAPAVKGMDARQDPKTGSITFFRDGKPVDANQLSESEKSEARQAAGITVKSQTKREQFVARVNRFKSTLQGSAISTLLTGVPGSFTSKDKARQYIGDETRRINDVRVPAPDGSNGMVSTPDSKKKYLETRGFAAAALGKIDAIEKRLQEAKRLYDAGQIAAAQAQFNEAVTLGGSAVTSLTNMSGAGVPSGPEQEIFQSVLGTASTNIGGINTLTLNDLMGNFQSRFNLLRETRRLINEGLQETYKDAEGRQITPAESLVLEFSTGAYEE